MVVHIPHPPPPKKEYFGKNFLFLTEVSGRKPVKEYFNISDSDEFSTVGSMEFVIGLNDLLSSFVLTFDWLNTKFSFSYFPTKLISLLSIEF